MKLAHFSDIHVTHWPLGEGFALKRLAAVASYSLMGRGRRFEDSPARITGLLDDVDAQNVDHVLCTGDLTGVSGESEFSDCAACFGARLQQPQRYTVIPGNHDRYVDSATKAELFEKHFAGLCEGAKFPFLKRVAPGVVLVAIDVCRPTNLIDSSGLTGAAQLEALEAMLTDASLKDSFVVLALHYGLMRANGHRDSPAHGIRDDVELTALLDRADLHLDVVVHGHLHRAFVQKTQRRFVINAGSATDSHVSCGYNVYDIDAAAHRLTISRREWNDAQSRYDAVPDSPLNRTLETR